MRLQRRKVVPHVVYELRPWSDNAHCLYTDDVRVKELVARSRKLRIVGTYFRTHQETTPFAWDIVGKRDDLAGITRRLGQSPRAGRV
jgi:hypothetical protein